MKNVIITIAIILAVITTVCVVMALIPSEELFEARSQVVEERTGMEVIGGENNNFIVVNSQGICYLYIMGGSPASSQLVPYYNTDGTAMTQEQYLNQGVE